MPRKRLTKYRGGSGLGPAEIPGAALTLWGKLMNTAEDNLGLREKWQKETKAKNEELQKQSADDFIARHAKNVEAQNRAEQSADAAQQARIDRGNAMKRAKDQALFDRLSKVKHPGSAKFDALRKRLTGQGTTPGSTIDRLGHAWLDTVNSTLQSYRDPDGQRALEDAIAVMPERELQDVLKDRVKDYEAKDPSHRRTTPLYIQGSKKKYGPATRTGVQRR